jgi:hypothetical protein
VVRQDAARHAEQVRPGGPVDRYVVEPAPGHEHRLRDDVGRVVRVRHPPQRIAEQWAEVVVEQLAETELTIRNGA